MHEVSYLLHGDKVKEQEKMDREVEKSSQMRWG